MAGRLYRMAKVVSANPASWGIVDANQISGFRTVATQADLYSIAACILSSSYGDGTTNGADAVGQIWHVQEGEGKDFRLINWSKRGSAEGWIEEIASAKLSSGIVNATAAAKEAKELATTANNTANAAKSQATANATAIAGKADASTVTKLSTKVNGIETTVSSHTKDISQIKPLVEEDHKTIGEHAKLLDKKADLVNGKLDPEQLPDIDTTLYELAPNNTLPSTLTDINKNHIYLVKAATAGTNNVYAEYIYTGTSATYDATKWEKLGEVTAKMDMSGYATTIYVQNAVSNAKHDVKPDTVNFTKHTDTTDLDIDIRNSDGTKLTKPVSIPLVNIDNNTNGLMSPTMLTKLNGIATGANNYTHPSHTGAKEGLYKITVDNLGHVSKATPVEKDDITGLGIPGGIPALTAEVTMTPGTNTIHFVHGDNTPYVVLKTATSKEAGLCSVAMWNKLNSLNVADTPLYGSSDLVTGNGIINAIDSHIVNEDNLDALDTSKIETYTITGVNNTDTRLTQLTDSLVYTFDQTGHSVLRIDNRAVLTDADVTAISNDDLTKILV